MNNISGLDIVMVFAIILFARLGIRLFQLYKKAKEEKDKEDE